MFVVIIRYFFIMLILLLLSGFWMFIEHTLLRVDGVISYYEPKSFFGLLETVSPHLFGMGVAVFILTHFYAVIKNIQHKRAYWLSIGLFVIMLISNLSPFFIVNEVWSVGLIKLLSTFLLFGGSIFIVIDLSSSYSNPYEEQ